MHLLAVLLFSYFLGGLPTGLLLGKTLAHTDIRQSGSGNIGSTNVLRTLGVKIGLLTFAGDFGKGALSIWFARLLVPYDPLATALALFFSVFGHCYSPFLHFYGGKGVATICGAMMVVDTPLTLFWLAIFFVIVIGTRFVSLGSLLAVSGSTIYTLFFTAHPPVIRVALLFCALVCVYRHKDNIQRLIQGKEARIGGDHAD
ncbi:glycerol-3-phosphate 1-O-acyltransferase PlsY [Murdochiella massiliensis]|uniref:glycerol-3-phosphate 1-O-acyltransferase PlsY n=1 Tax=Murdochiella massiliensis TaxID=1673723 RepID=UPI000836B489|nr:glycerol-3-phosphate 1-O-acyltransferase PlsY [Murdochiella massiliensis]